MDSGILPNVRDEAGLPTLTSADVASAGGERVGVILGLAPAWPHATLVAPAFTASGIAGDNLVLHRALARAASGSALVVSLAGDVPVGHWGELMSIAAITAGIRGVVLTGSVRDVVKIEALRFPVFHAGVGPRPATKSHRGELETPVQVGGVTIYTGDIVVADRDGIAIIPSGAVDAVLADVSLLERREAELVHLLERGVTTVDALGLE